MNSPLLSPDATVRLLAWFDKEGKSYPWGEEINPYRVWVSEIMLQQTVVTAAVPFFTRWMERFPSPLDLAEAEEEEVLRYWEGLGYYSRGRNLLKAARYLRDHLNGQLPGDLEGWKALPGVGDYTARAVLSIALGRPYPVLDANVRRIGQRILGRRLWPSGADRELMTALEESIPPREPGKFNAAMMQLGQLVCRTGIPLCPSCPLRQECIAASEGTAAEIPEKKSRIQTVLYSRRFLLNRGGRIFMIRRDHGIGRGLWVFPGVDDTVKSGGDAVVETGESVGAGSAAVRFPAAGSAGWAPVEVTTGDVGEDLAAEGGSVYCSGLTASGEASGDVGPADDAGNTGGAARTPEVAIGTDPRGFPRGIEELLIPMVEKSSPFKLKQRRHTYTRYREELMVEVVNWAVPAGAADKEDRECSGDMADVVYTAVAADPVARLEKSDLEGADIKRLEELYSDAGWEARWFSLEEIDRLPLPTIYRKIMEEIREGISKITDF